MLAQQYKRKKFDVSEPDSEFCQIFDTLTSGTIICANRSHAHSTAWIAKYATNAKLIDVTKVIPFDIVDGFAFTHDSFIDHRKSSLQKYTRMLVDFACLLHFHLCKNGKVVIFCKNGRSRSPNIILALLLLRGLNQDHAVSWLNTAFAKQRPTIANKSANFPNFAKFYNVTLTLARNIEQQETWITQRISECLESVDLRQPQRTLKEKDIGKHLIRRCGARSSLPNSAFCPPSSNSTTSSGSSSGTSSSATSRPKRKRRVIEPTPDPNVFCVGRRIKVTPTDKLGTLKRCVSENIYEVVFDDGKEKEVSLDRVTNAFEIGTRVQVNWERSGEWYSGVVTSWNGSSEYKVWYDTDKKCYPTKGSEMILCTKALPDKVPFYIRSLVEGDAKKNDIQEVLPATPVSKPTIS